MGKTMQRRALLVGINDYPSAPLEYCVEDAEALNDCLKMDGYDFATDLQVADVTSSHLRKSLDDLFSAEASFYLFYYSGHGFRSRFDTHFVTPELNDRADGLSFNYLNNLIRGAASQTASILIILDCCHAGAFNLQEKRPLITKEDIKNAITPQGVGRVVLASCLENEESAALSTFGHSLFTKFLLEGLLGNAVNHRGEVIVSQLYAYVEKQLMQINASSPLMTGYVSDAIVIGDHLTPNVPDSGSSLSIDAIRDIELKATRYQLQIKSLMEVRSETERWTAQGYRNAQDILPDIFKWFEEKSKNATLKESLAFRSAVSVVESAQRTMASLYVGLRTTRGVVKDEIGGGGFGKVWKVKADDGTEYAYKVCHPHILDNREMVGWFRRGFRAMKQLNHPNVVRVSNIDGTEAPLGFYMQYIDGPNWHQYPPFSYLNLEQKLHQLIQLTEVIDYAHKAGTVHRDIKPQNIIVRFNADGDVKDSVLTDFDLAWYTLATIVQGDSVKSLVNTYRYASPEFRHDPEREVARKHTTDVYSFGQLIYFVFSGFDPDPLSINDNLLKKALDQWPSAIAADELLALYRDCTETSPSHRVTGMGVVRDRLISILSAIELKDETHTAESFLDQVMFYLIGVDRKKNIKGLEAQLASIVDRHSIDFNIAQVRDRYIDLVVTCTALQELNVNGSRTYRDSKELLYTALGKISDTAELVRFSMLKPDYTTIFQVDIELNQIPLNSSGVLEVVKLLRKMISVLEAH